MARAKRSETTVTVSDDNGMSLDEASARDVDVKNATLAFEAARSNVVELAEVYRGDFDNVRLVGPNTSALVSFTERVSVDVSSETFPQVAEAVEKGQLDGIIQKTRVARIAPSAIDSVIAALRGAGIDVDKVITVETGYKVDPEGFRDFDRSTVASPERLATQTALRGAIESKTATKVTFAANRG